MPIKPIMGLMVVVLLIATPIFSHLDEFPLQIWDESRLANNAIEMYKTGDLIVTTYGYEPDMWSTKPPLLIWLQVLSLKTLGLTDLAFRLPSALAALFTCIFLYWFFVRKFKVPWLGILSCLALVTSSGYVSFHGIRTGDYDSLLTLCTTMYVLYFFLYLEEDNKGYLLLSLLFITLATLTKGIAGLFLVPALLIYTIYKKKLLTVLKTPQLYAGIVGFLFFVVGYYLLREHYNPGYIKAVMDNEVFGRYNTVIEGHEGDALYYYNYIINTGFNAWYLLYAVGTVLGFISKNKLIRDLTVFTFTCSLSLIIILAAGNTKIYWYLLPLYPLMATTIATLVYTVCEALENSKFWQPYLRYNLLPYVLVFIIFLTPYADVLRFVTFQHGNDDNATNLAEVIKTTLKGKYPYAQPMKLVYYDYNSELEWYLKIATLRNIPITHNDKYDLAKEDLVGVYDDKLKKIIEYNYYYHIVQTFRGATIYQVHGLKPVAHL